MRLLACLLAFLPCLAQTEQSAVEGQVFNLATGEPVRKAQVLLRPEGSSSRQPYGAITGASGRFSITAVAPGRYILTVERAGFVSATYGGRSPNRRGTIALSPGEHLRDLVFRLTPHGVITGRVLDEEGEPVAGATVHALRYGYAQGRRSLMPATSSTTNDIGEYRLAGLAPGRYYLSATYRAMAVFNRFSEESYAPTYFPGTADPAAAAPLQVIQGNQIRGMDITLTRTGTVRVSGRVTNPAAGEGRRNVMVFLVPRDGGIRGVGNRNSSVVKEGKFEISEVIPGAYVIAAHWYEDGKRYTASQPLDVGSGGVENVSLTLAPGFDVKGRVRIEGSTEASADGIMVMLQAAFDEMTGGAGGRTQPDGAFLLRNVSPGHYRVRLLFGAPEGCYLKSARLGDTEMLASGASVTSGSASLEIVLSASGGQVDGVALDERQQPVPNTLVVLLPDERRRQRADLFRTASPDQNGRFTIKGIAPGDYKLLAFDGVEPGAWQDPDFLKQYETRGQAVSIKENGRETAQLKVVAVEQP